MSPRRPFDGEPVTDALVGRGRGRTATFKPAAVTAGGGC